MNIHKKRHRREQAIKRPLVLYMVFGILGEVIALYGNIWLLIIVLGLVVAVVRYRKLYDMRYYLILLFVISGYIVMTLYNLNIREDKTIEYYIENEVSVTVSGTVSSITTKDDKAQIILKDVIVSSKDDLDKQGQDNNLSDVDSKVEADKKLQNNGYNIKKTMVYINGDISSIKYGNKILVRGNVSRFKEDTNLGGFNLMRYYRSQNIIYPVYADEYNVIDKSYYYISNTAYKIATLLKESIYKACDEKNASVFSAMILGDKKNLDEEIYELYKKNGIAHILAISGLHISLVGMSFYKLLRRIGLNYAMSATAGSGFIIFYGLMTGMGISSQRAIIMFVICVIADVIGRTYDILSAMSLSALIMLAYSPYLIENAGFLLSYLAIVGITVVNPVLLEEYEKGITKRDKDNAYKGEKDRTTEYPFIKSIIKSIICSLSITLITMPVIMYMSYEIPLYSILLNLLIIPLAPIIIFSGASVAVSGLLSIKVATFCSGIGIMVLKLYEISCRLLAMVPYSTIITGKPGMINIVLYYVIFIVALMLIKTSHREYGLVGMIIAVICLTFSYHSSLEVTMLDVGQGDGIVIRDYRGSIYMIDGGSTTEKQLAKYTLIPFYKAYGISSIDYVIITHMDADHYSGIKEILEEDSFKINNLIMGDVANKSDAYNELVELATKRGVKVSYISDGMMIKNGKFSLECLSPESGTYKDNTNEVSVALELNYNDVKMLFTGDIVDSGEEYMKKRIMQKYANEVAEYDILKVAHHGSKYSTTEEFLEGIDIQNALISCSDGNRYGHPHDETLERLISAGAKIYNTKDSGAIMVELGMTGKVKIKEYAR